MVFIRTTIQKSKFFFFELLIENSATIARLTCVLIIKPSMTSDASKQRRVMIITADDDIIDEIQRTNDPSLLKKLILESDTDNRITEARSLSSSKRPQPIQPGTLTCVVCKSPANGYNFGVIACESCKTFFRRNALKTSVSCSKKKKKKTTTCVFVCD